MNDQTWTIVEIRRLDGKLVLTPFYDESYVFTSELEAQRELSRYGRPQDFKIIKLPKKK